MYTGFFNSWENQISSKSQHIYCDFHVKKCWRKNVKQYIKDTDQQQIIFEYLDNLTIEQNEDKFNKILQAFLVYSLSINANFFNYFNTYYGKKKEKWGLPFRTKCLFNTNNYAESFFKKLKYRYLKKKTNSRIDELFLKLNNMNTIILKEEIVKNESQKKEHQSYRCKKSLENHKNSGKLNSSLISEISSNTFTYKAYTLRIKKKYSSYNPNKVICTKCYIHFDEISCSCLNYTKTKSICKHIHLLASSEFLPEFTSRYNDYISEKRNSIKVGDLSRSTEKRSLNIDEGIGAKSVGEAKNVGRKEVGLLSEFADLNLVENAFNDIRCATSNLSSNLAISEKLSEIKALISTSSLSDFQTTGPKKGFNNRSITVKQREISVLVSSKESLNFKRLSKKRGSKVKGIIKSFRICMSCYFIDDDTSCPTIDWIECLKCRKWYHKHCLLEQLEEVNADYHCC